MSETNATTSTSRRLNGHGRWLWLCGGALAALAVVAVAAPRVWAFRGAVFSPHGASGGHGFPASMMRDPAAAKQHAGLAVEFLLRGVGASDEQRQQARRITDRLIDELTPALEKHRLHHEVLGRELAKPQIDRDAIERLRREEVAVADEASRKLAAAVADLAEVLTPEQRAELLDLVQRFHGVEPHPIG